MVSGLDVTNLSHVCLVELWPLSIIAVAGPQGWSELDSHPRAQLHHPGGTHAFDLGAHGSANGQFLH